MAVALSKDPVAAVRRLRGASADDIARERRIRGLAASFMYCGLADGGALKEELERELAARTPRVARYLARLRSCSADR